MKIEIIAFFSCPIFYGFSMVYVSVMKIRDVYVLENGGFDMEIFYYA